MYPHQIWYTEAPGYGEDQVEPGAIDLLFKVTEVIHGDEIWMMVSAEYLKKYLMCPHQIWYTEAPRQDDLQVGTGCP